MNNERFSCSAALIAPGVLVTSAHCIADYGTDTVASGLLQFIPGRFDSYAPYGVWSVQRICYPTVFAKGADECRPDANGVLCANDLAVLILNPDSDGNYVGNSTGWMGYAWGGYSFSSSFKADTLTAEITQLGYPCQVDSCTRMVRTDAPAITQDYNQQVMGSDQAEGSNGGPWIVNFGAEYVSQLSDPGIDSKPNIIMGVTTWYYNNQSLKVGFSRIKYRAFLDYSIDLVIF